MGLWSVMKFVVSSPLGLVRDLNKTTNELFRAGFVATALSEGIFERLKSGPATPDDILRFLGAEGDADGIAAWLDLGVSLGELARTPKGYRIDGGISRRLERAGDEAWAAFLQSRVQMILPYVLNTPELVRRGAKLELAHGALAAKASRTVEPLLLDLSDRLVPATGACRILEVGCGTGVYMRRACARNPQVEVTGLELQEDAAELARENLRAWGLGDRTTVHTKDVREFEGGPFDLVTLHNLIYYFPLTERVPLLRALRSKLTEGALLVMTSMCQRDDPPFRAMNLWSSMTRGCGPLPVPDELEQQLRDAGFRRVVTSSLMPGFMVFEAE